MTDIKQVLVNYSGEKRSLKVEEDDVTVEMLVEDLCEGFPELVLKLAEENFIRGYQQAINDVRPLTKWFQKSF